MSLHLSRCQIVGNLMPRLIIISDNLSLGYFSLLQIDYQESKFKNGNQFYKLYAYWM